MKVLKIVGLIGGICFLSQAAAAAVYELEENKLQENDHRYQIFIAEHNAILNGVS